MKAKSESCSPLAIPFVTYHPEKGFQLNSKAADFLEAIDDSFHVAIVAIVGKYRTGKSFFVNRVLLEAKKAGFQVGNTINPCTKGLWLWSKQVMVKQKTVVLLVDTEGFGGMDQNLNHDSRIFLFAMLASSFFIYNSVGSIDQNSLNTLNLIINLAQKINSKADSSPDFPTFLWVVRDFALQMVNRQGAKISQKQYLEKALEEQKGTSEAVQNKNKLRRLFKKHFPDRLCRTMVRPVESEKDLKRLDELDNSQIRPEFLRQVNQIRQLIFSTIQPKRVNGLKLNGKMMSMLLKSYVDAVNKGALPSVQNSWNYVKKGMQHRALLDTLQLTSRRLQSLSVQNFQEEISHLKQQLLEQFQRKCYGEIQQDSRKEFQKRVDDKIARKLKELRTQLLVLYEDTIQHHLSPIDALNYDSTQLISKYQQLQATYKELPDCKEKWQIYHQQTNQFVNTLKEKIEFQNQLREKADKANFNDQLEEWRLKVKQLELALCQEQRLPKGVSLAELQRQDEAIRKLQLAKLSVQDERDQLIRQLKRKQGQILKIQTHHEERSKKLKQEVQTLQRTVSSQRKENQLVRAEYQSATSQLYEMSNRVSLMEQTERDTIALRSEKQMLQLMNARLTQQIQQDKRRYDQVIQAFSNDSRPLAQQNTALTTSIQKLQIRSERLEEKCQKLKVFKKMVKSSSHLTCAECKRTIPVQQFQTHSCTFQQENRPLVFQTLKFSIVEIRLEKEEDGKCLQYVIQARLANKQWRVARKYKQFCQLHKQLTKLKEFFVPESAAVVKKSILTLPAISKNSEERRKQLQRYLQDLWQQSSVRESKQFQRFIGLA